MKFNMLVFIALCARGVSLGDVAAVALPERTLPVIDTVDLVVVGSSEAGLGAAYAAGKAGARVILISDYTFLGDEFIAKVKRDLAKGPAPKTEFAQKLLSCGY